MACFLLGQAKDLSAPLYISNLTVCDYFCVVVSQGKSASQNQEHMVTWKNRFQIFLPLFLLTFFNKSVESVSIRVHKCSGVPRGGFRVFKPPPGNSEDIGEVLDLMSKKNRRLDFLLQFTVFSYGCNLFNKGFF